MKQKRQADPESSLPVPAQAADADESSDRAERPNKSAAKRETQTLRRLAQQLADLPPGRLSALPLTDNTRDAFEQYRRIRPGAHGGRRRQMQLIIKFLRQEDTAAIASHLEQERQAQRADGLALPGLVELRAGLLDSDTTLQEFIDRHQLDNEFRTLARKARRERERAADTGISEDTPAQRALLRRLQKVFSDNS